MPNLLDLRVLVGGLFYFEFDGGIVFACGEHACIHQLLELQAIGLIHGIDGDFDFLANGRGRFAIARFAPLGDIVVARGKQGEHEQRGKRFFLHNSFFL